MHQKIYRTLSTDETHHSLNNNARTHIKQLLKETKHLKARSTMTISHINQTLTNFHTDHLREAIHNNQDYQKIFLTAKSGNSSQRKPQLHKRNPINHLDNDIPAIHYTYSPSESTHLDSLSKQNKTSTLFYSFKHNNIILRNSNSNTKEKHDLCKSNAHLNSQAHTYTNNNHSSILSQTIGSTYHSNHSKTKLKLKSSDYPNSKELYYKSKSHTRNHNHSPFNIIQYNPNLRNESLTAFLSKVNEIGKEKYIQSLQNEYYSKLTKDSQTKVDEVNLDIYNYTTSFDLLKLYSTEYDLYQKHLYKVINKEKDINDDLKDQVTQLKNDIERLNKRQMKQIQMFNENYKTKFFLMCVKNCSNRIEKFSKKDLEEFKNDQLIIQNLMSSNKLTTLFGIKNEKIILPKRRNTKRLSMVSQQIYDGSTLLKQNGVNHRFRRLDSIRFSHNEPMFNSAEDFYANLDNITNTISLSLNDYNITELELHKIQKEYQEEMIECDKDQTSFTSVNSILKEIKQKEELLNHVKEKNYILNNTLKSLPQPKVDLIKVRNKLKRMAMEYNQVFPMGSDILNYKNITSCAALLSIEKILISLLEIHKKYKELCPQEYLKKQYQREKENKINLTKTLIMLEKTRIINKNNRVIEKSTKFIFKPYRKIDLLQKPIMTEGNHIKSSNRISSEGNLDDYLKY